METLNTTATNPDPKAAVRKHFDFARLLVLRDRLPWFWFFFTITVLLLSAIDRYHLVSQSNNATTSSSLTPLALTT
jgi:hypothetical protein